MSRFPIFTLGITLLLAATLSLADDDDQMGAQFKHTDAAYYRSHGVVRALMVTNCKMPNSGLSRAACKAAQEADKDSK